MLNVWGIRQRAMVRYFMDFFALFLHPQPSPQKPIFLKAGQAADRSLLFCDVGFRVVLCLRH